MNFQPESSIKIYYSPTRVEKRRLLAMRKTAWPGVYREKKIKPQKKQKLKDEVKAQVGFSTNINSLPDEMLIQIFSYLRVEDRFKAEKVCIRWQQLVRSEVLWRNVNLINISNSFFIEILTSLPSSISQLRLQCCSEPLPFSLPEVIAKLHQQCPLLNTLILEKVHLLKKLHSVNGYCTRRSKLHNNRLLEEAMDTLDEPFIKLVDSEFRKEDEIELLDASLPELKVLSLRRVLFNKFHIFSHISISAFPKIVVLDLSYCSPLPMAEIKGDAFCSLVNLEEIYLAGWEVRDLNIIRFLKYVKKLKVLDLEFTNVTNNIISAFEPNSAALEKLCLCSTDIRDLQKTTKDKEFFPRLQVLCLKNTDFTHKGIEELFTLCPTLKHINISECEYISEVWYRGLSKDLKNKLVFNTDEIFNHCDHFTESGYHNY